MKIGEFSFVVRTKKYWFIYKNNQFEVIFLDKFIYFPLKHFDCIKLNNISQQKLPIKKVVRKNLNSSQIIKKYRPISTVFKKYAFVMI
jgi:hypothetical protein